MLVDIPKDITALTADYAPDSSPVRIRSYNPVSRGHVGQIKRALQLIKNARKLMVYSGGGVILGNASAELTKLVQKLRCPGDEYADGIGCISRR